MKVFDQLAGALGSLSLRREERRRREEKREEEKSRDGMVEMFRKSVEETGNTLQVKETQKTEDTSYASQSNLTKWGRVGNLDQGSGMPEGSARSRMFEEKKATTSRMPEDVARSGRVRKARGQSKGEVEVLRFLSLKLVGDQQCLQEYLHFTSLE